MPETAAPYYRVAADHPSVEKPRPRSAACGSRQGEGRQFQALLATSLAANPRADVNHRRQAPPFGDAPTWRDRRSSLAEKAGDAGKQTPRYGVTWNGRVRLAEVAMKHGLAGVSSAREMVEAGLFVSYGPNYADMFRRAAEYVDKILRGVDSADLPVEQAVQYQLLINLKPPKRSALPFRRLRRRCTSRCDWCSRWCFC